ncbi:MAG: TetR family transcriptional regulator [Shinella sp.]|nr:MAG: TetR family transcriptional regulator [Shinella sp.]
MGRKNTRETIVETADRLFYEHGYEHTSFADIGEAVQISRGNFYYHFRTKDEILEAVIERRLERTEAMLAQWDEEAETPRERIVRFVEILIVNQSKIMQHGCPVGTLCGELAKLDHPSLPMANRLFTLFRSWLSRQFVALGRVADADDLAMHLLVRSQGVAVLANTFRDGVFVRREVRMACDWLDHELSSGQGQAGTAIVTSAV